jgi:hypothetical protein
LTRNDATRKSEAFRSAGWTLGGFLIAGVSGRSIKSFTPSWCLFGLWICAPFGFFGATRVLPAAKDLMVLVDKYPIAMADTRTWLPLALLVLWVMLVLLCGLLAQAFNKRLVADLHDGE